MKVVIFLAAVIFFPWYIWMPCGLIYFIYAMIKSNKYQKECKAAMRRSSINEASWHHTGTSHSTFCDNNNFEEYESDNTMSQRTSWIDEDKERWYQEQQRRDEDEERRRRQRDEDERRMRELEDMKPCTDVYRMLQPYTYNQFDSEDPWGDKR